MLTEQNIIKCFEIYPIKYTTIQELRIFFNDENLYHQIPKSIRVSLEKGLQNYSREYRTTGRKKMLFQPGHYFSEKPIL